MKKFHGIIAVTVTPFLENGSIDYTTAEKHLNWLIESGVHGVLPLGATGEFAALSMEERKEYASFAMKTVKGRVPVMIGAVSQNIETTIEVSRHAAEIGADAVMVLPPPGLHTSQVEIYEFYKHISANVTLPVMVYNNPGSAGVDIAPETMERIATLPHMEYLKESTGDLRRMTRMLDTLAHELVIFCGCEELAYESFAMGAKGWICVLANIAPAQCVQLYEMVAQKGELANARPLYKQMLPMLRLIEETGELWQVVKYGMKHYGFGSGALRLPRQPISSATKAAADAILAATKFA